MISQVNTRLAFLPSSLCSAGMQSVSCSCAACILEAQQSALGMTFALIVGAVEALFTVLALQHRQAPPTANLEAADPAIKGIRLVQGKAAALQGPDLLAMSNSFGFGGTNASLVFRSAPSKLPSPSGWKSTALR